MLHCSFLIIKVIHIQIRKERERKKVTGDHISPCCFGVKRGMRSAKLFIVCKKYMKAKANI